MLFHAGNFPPRRKSHRRPSYRSKILRAMLALAFLAVVGAAGRSGAEDNPRATAKAWPQYKGDSARTGDNPEAGLSFPLARVVAVRLPSPIYASPAVVGDRVYVQDARGHLICVDSRANRVVWSAENGGINNSSSPAVYQGKVYVGSTAGHLAIFDAANGRPVARVPAQGAVVAAPAAANGAVYFSTLDGYLTKIDPDGTVRWTFNGGETSITEFAVQGERIVFFAGTRQANAYRLTDRGDEVEVVQRGRPAGGYFAPTGGPAMLAGDEFASQSYDSESGWFHALGKAVEAGSNDSRITPSVRGNQLHRGNKCWEFDLEAKSFRELWRADAEALYDGGFHSSPALARDALVIGSERGIVYFLPLNGEGGSAKKPPVRQPLWQYAIEGAGEPNGAVSSSPAVVDGRVYFGGEDGVLYGLGNGDEVPVVRAALVKQAWERKTAKVPPGRDWVTGGGDMGFSCVAEESPVKPPLRIRWRTRVWSTYKGNMIAAEGKVFCAGRMGPLTAVDVETGEILWKTHHAGVESRPAPTYADGRLYVLRVQGGLATSPYFRGWWGGPNGEGLWCHDASTGKVLWHRPIPTAYHFNSDAVAAYDGRVFVCQEGGDGQLVAAAYDGETGEAVWTQPIAGVEPSYRNRGLQRPRRFSGVISEGMYCVSVSGTAALAGATLALDAHTGEIVWRNDQVFIESRARIAARNGTLVVFNSEGSHGFEARTGKATWTAASITPPSLRGKQRPTFYMQALTDRFLESQGSDDVFPISGCILPVYVNGLWYSHTSNSSHVMHARDEKKTVWSRTFLSHACPSPVPAYGRLYYSPNSEGVIYCFENQHEEVSE